MANPSESVTLRLGGSVSVAEFVRRAGMWSRVLEGLTEELGASGAIRWQISGLEYSSAILSATPMPDSPEGEPWVPRIVSEYLEVARSVRSGLGDSKRPVLRLVRDLAATATPDSEVTFETRDDDVTFFGLDDELLDLPEPEPVPAIGTVRGRVEMLTQRRGFRFTLYDLLSDRAIHCYLSSDKAELLRSAWGHVADVTGVVKRDPKTDRPVTIRRVSSIEVVPEAVGESYRRARGVIRPTSSARRSEDLIRSLREEL